MSSKQSGIFLALFHGRLSWRAKGLQNFVICQGHYSQIRKAVSLPVDRKSNEHGRKIDWMNRDLITEFKHRKEIHKYGNDSVQRPRVRVRKANAHLEL